MKVPVFFLVVWVAAAAGAQTPGSFWLRNTDPSAVFYYWTVAGPGSKAADQVLPTLALAPGGRHGVAPGERVKVSLGGGQDLVGVFVPWQDNLSFRTPLVGGFLLASEAPAKGTLQVDRSSFQAANRGRSLGGSVQDWGLSVPQFVLDGQVSDWAKVPDLVEWGPAFFADPGRWPKTWPRLRSIQAADREGALWVRLAADGAWGALPAGTTVSLVLRRPGAFLQWPLTGGDGTVWSWSEGVAPTPVGWRIVGGTDLEAWVPWDRLPDSEKKAWTGARAVWGVLVTESGASRVLDLAPTVLGEWP